MPILLGWTDLNSDEEPYAENRDLRSEQQPPKCISKLNRLEFECSVRVAVQFWVPADNPKIIANVLDLPK